MSTTALIILNYNNFGDTCNCVRSVLQHNTAPVKFFVVDNASHPDDRQALLQGLQEIFGDRLQAVGAGMPEYPYDDAQCVLICNDANEGYAKGNNIGLDAAYEDSEIEWVMILNNDILFVQDIIPELIRVQEETPRCGIVSPVLYKRGLAELDINCARRDEPVSEMMGKNFLHYWRRMRKKDNLEVYPHRYILSQSPAGDEPLEIELPSGSCMLVSKQLMREIGSFDPRTFLYYEENILYRKLKLLGRKNYICLGLKCVHLGAQTTSAISNSYKIVKAGVDSQLIYVRDYVKPGALVQAMHWLSTRFFLLSFKAQKLLTSK